MNTNAYWAAIGLLLAAVILPVLGQQTAEDWYNKGAVLYAQGKYDDVITCFDEAIRLNPNLAEAWYGKGVALGLLGRNTDAQEAYAKARELGYTG